MALQLLTLLGEQRRQLTQAGDELRLHQGRAAAQRQQDRLDFLSVVSHELKTPVAVIKAYAEVLQERAAERGWEREDRELLGHITEQADLMLRLVEEVLDVGRLQLGKLQLTLSRFDLRALARQVGEEIQRTTRRHEVVVQGPGEPVVITADRQRMRELLHNLLENAVKYAPRGRIELTVEARDGQAHVAVHDEGVGLAPEARERIFERFEQGNSRPVRGHVGLGLGLYIARAIVEAHGGRIWAESPGPGQGSTFHFTLPLTGPGLADPPLPGSRAASHSAGESTRRQPPPGA